MIYTELKVMYEQINLKALFDNKEFSDVMVTEHGISLVAEKSWRPLEIEQFTRGPIWYNNISNFCCFVNN